MSTEKISINWSSVGVIFVRTSSFFRVGCFIGMNRGGRRVFCRVWYFSKMIALRSLNCVGGGHLYIGG